MKTRITKSIGLFVASFFMLALFASTASAMIFRCGSSGFADVSFDGGGHWAGTGQACPGGIVFRLEFGDSPTKASETGRKFLSLLESNAQRVSLTPLNKREANAANKAVMESKNIEVIYLNKKDVSSKLRVYFSRIDAKWEDRVTGESDQATSISDIDVSIEQNPGGIMKGKTGPDGSATFARVNPGPIKISTTHWYHAHKHGLAVSVSSTGGGKPASGIWSDDSKAFTLEMDVKGRGLQKVTVTVQMLDAPSSRVKGESDQALSRVKGESDQATPIAGVVVTIKKSRAFVATGTTNAQGSVTFVLSPGQYDFMSTAPPDRTSSNYNSHRSNTAGIAGGATVDSGSFTFTPTTPGMARITVAGPGSKMITVTFKDAPTLPITNSTR